NVAGARDLGFPIVTSASGDPDTSPFRLDIQQGHVSALYVFDPGSHGSIGDTSWIVDARKSGQLPMLIVQGVLMTPLAQAADIVLAGASWVEKDGAYVNGAGRVQGAAQVIAPPGDALEDWRVFLKVGQALGVPLTYETSAAVRAEIAAALAGEERYSSL